MPQIILIWRDFENGSTESVNVSKNGVILLSLQNLGQTFAKVSWFITEIFYKPKRILNPFFN